MGNPIQKNFAVYKLTETYERQGDIGAVFVADVNHVNYLVQHSINIDYGEYFGRFSEVIVQLKENNTCLISTDLNVLELVTKHDLICGDNPLSFYSRDFDHSCLKANATAQQKDDCDNWSVQQWLNYLLYDIIPQDK